MATREALHQMQHDAAVRLAAGEPVTEVADDYGISRITLWRWNNQAVADAMPHMDNRDEWREELTGVLSERIRDASLKGDDRNLVTLIDRLAKLNGLDHTHRVDEARLQLDAARVRMLADRMGNALDAAGIPKAKQLEVLEQIAAQDG